MEKKQNTAIIELDLYNRLRDFKKNIEKNYTVKLTHSFYGGDSSITYISKDETVQELKKKMTILEGKFRSERDYNYRLNQQIKNYPTIEKLKKMTIWEFIKFRKQKIN